MSSYVTLCSVVCQCLFLSLCLQCNVAFLLHDPSCILVCSRLATIASTMAGVYTAIQPVKGHWFLFELEPHNIILTFIMQCFVKDWNNSQQFWLVLEFGNLPFAESIYFPPVWTPIRTQAEEAQLYPHNDTITTVWALFFPMKTTFHHLPSALMTCSQTSVYTSKDATWGSSGCVPGSAFFQG